MDTGQSVSIIIGGAVTPTGVFSEMFHGTVGKQTAKGIELVADDGASVWIPKSMIKTDDDGALRLDKVFWSFASYYQEWFFNNYSEVRGSSF